MTKYVPILAWLIAATSGCSIELAHPCSDQTSSCVELEVAGAAPLTRIDKLEISVNGSPFRSSTLANGQPADLPIAVALLLGDQLPPSIAVEVFGQLGGARVGHGTTQKTLSANGSRLTVILSGELPQDAALGDAPSDVGVTVDAALDQATDDQAIDAAESDLAASGLDMAELPDATLLDLESDLVPPIDFAIPRYFVSASATGAPSSTQIVASSTTVDATCVAASCDLPKGGNVTFTAPTIAGYFFDGWTGGLACTSTAQVLEIASVTSSFSCTATYRKLCQVTVSVMGGPSGASITPTTTTTGASCAAGGCTVPASGSVQLTAPTYSGWVFNGWTGGINVATATTTVNVGNADVAVTANYALLYEVDIVVSGPSGASITPSSTAIGAVCTPGKCMVPSGAVVTATAPQQTDWYFVNWTGDATTSNTNVSVTVANAGATLQANYVNQRVDPCRDTPPANGTSTSHPTSIVTFTTANGWALAPICPWSCNTDFCKSGATCVETFTDKIANLYGTGVLGLGSQSIYYYGEGQKVTVPTSAVTMDRFGFNFTSGFSNSAGQPSQVSSPLRLHVRDAAGVVLATYEVTLPPSFAGGWVYWNTSARALNASTTYIFTTFLTNHATNKVAAGMAADYTGGTGEYTGINDNGASLDSWSYWSSLPWALQYRIQQHNPACE